MKQEPTEANLGSQQESPYLQVWGGSQHQGIPRVVCDTFFGKPEWGEAPEPWRPCQDCGWPCNQHSLPHCPAELIVAGQSYLCDLHAPHDGVPHINDRMAASWK